MDRGKGTKLPPYGGRPWSINNKMKHGTDIGANDKPGQKESVFPLSIARARQLVRVVDTRGCGRRRMKLAALGLTTGVQIKVCCAMGGPVAVEVRGSRLSLGRRLADNILVKAEGFAEGCDCQDGKVCPAAPIDEDTLQ